MTKPNFIIFLTDDQGYGDLSCMGNTNFQTPNIDSLADNGIRFTNWYSNSPVCSPSRASLLTGKYPGNAGVRSILSGHRTATGLPPESTSIATHLKKKNYQTFMTGKWHLGMQEASRPHSHGFDHWYGFLAGCIDYYSHIFYWGMNNPGPGINPTHDLWEDNKESWDNGKYFTEAITDKAISYIKESTKNDQPFLLYVPYNAPHYPMHAPKEYMERFSNLPWDRQVMAAMLSAVDDSIGRIMKELKDSDLVDDTCVFFTSDNGPSRESRNWLDGTLDPYYGGTTGKLKGHKFSLFEGGIKVPGIVQWPNAIKPGQVLDEPCASMDIVPSILSAIDVDCTDKELDGINLLPYMTEGIKPKERTLHFEMGNQTALRKGKWKLVLEGRLVEEETPSEDVFLSDLSVDEEEQNNLAKEQPEITSQLKKEALTWRGSIEETWDTKFNPEKQGTVTHPEK
ncbi:MAG: sulfatase [Planctomycetota bacterium]|nr:MAG: sulfatase [Planctomycetota bacterium]